MPQANSLPSASELNSSPPATGTGTLAHGRDASGTHGTRAASVPSAPRRFVPQQKAAPSAVRAQVKALMLLASLGTTVEKLRPPATSAGVLLPAKEPVPSEPQLTPG